MDKRRRPQSPEHKAAIAAGRLRYFSNFEGRFHAMVDSSGGPDACWPWKGGSEARKADTRRGYVKMVWHGKPTFIHRIAVLLDGRPARDDQVVDHMCRNVRCCNPKHLRPCSNAENVGPYANGKAPHWINMHKTHCAPGNHPLSGANLAIRRVKPSRRKAYLMRICLTCHPRWWRYAVIEREPPPGARTHWTGPDKL